MKILLVSPFKSYSGSCVRFWNIARQLRKSGFTVVYAERKAPGLRPQFSDPGIRYYSSRSFSNLYLDIAFSTIFNLCVAARHLDCSVYYALKPAPNNCIPALLMKLLGKRIILDIDDLDYGYFPEGPRRKISRFFFGFFPRFFEVVTCHTAALREFIVNQLGVPAQRVRYLAQGVSPEFLSAQPGRAERVPRSIVYAATLGITSDFSDIVPALDALCREYPDTAVSVIGDGPRRPRFEEQIASCAAIRKCTFYGAISHAQLPEFIARHWVGINYMRPSLTNDCRAILKIREYLACGLQVVCNGAGDAGLFENHVYIEETPEAMAGRISRLFKTGCPVNLEGRDFIRENFSWEKIMAGFLPLLRP